jgi:hypothetical protein
MPLSLSCVCFNCESLWSFQVCQLRAGFVKDEDELETMWERQHELGAEKMYSLCSELGGLFLKVGEQCAWVRPVLFFLPLLSDFQIAPTPPTKKARVTEAAIRLCAVTVTALVELRCFLSSCAA